MSAMASLAGICSVRSEPRDSTRLVIGADGFVGQRLQQLAYCDGTSRRNPYLLGNSYFLDIAEFTEADLPEVDVVYLCAAVNGAKNCEGSIDAWHVNVDATLRIIQHYSKKGAFVVWVSSRSLEWSNSAYARQKAYVECAVRTMQNVGVIRAGRVTAENVGNLCEAMIAVGRERKEGVTIWGDDDIAYKK